MIGFALSACVSDNSPPANDSTSTETGQLTSNFPSTGDLANGKQIFWAGGCASCHAEPNARGDTKLLLGGGMSLKTQFGTFNVPNISPDKVTGIGKWSNSDFSNALLKGIAPDGSHYYPSFPYTSYARMNQKDVSDLWSYLKTLPPVTNRVKGHEIPILIKSRKALGVWKKLYFSNKKVVQFRSPSAEIARGQYLVEGPGHCGECHTPRNAIGGFNTKKWLAGGKDENGEQTIPNITPHEDGIGDKSFEDILTSLEPASHDGGTPISSNMTYVRQNLAMLPLSDRKAIAAYLKAIPAIASVD